MTSRSSAAPCHSSTPSSHITIDSITDLPDSHNYTTILTVIDRFSKACCLIPLTKLPTAFETFEALLNQVFWFYGLPEDIVYSVFNHRTYPQSTTCYIEVRRLGIQLMCIFNKESAESRNRLITVEGQDPSSLQDSGFGYLLKISAFTFHAGNLVLGTWFLSKSLSKLLLYHIVGLFHSIIISHPLFMYPAQAHMWSEKSTPPIIIYGEEAYQVREILDS